MMKIKKGMTIFSILIIITSLVGCKKEIKETDTKETPNTKITINKEKLEIDKNKVIVYPSLQGIKNTEEVNKSLKKVFTGDVIIDSSIEDTKEDTYSNEYSDIYNKNGLLNIVSKGYYMPKGTPHGMPDKISVLIDTEKGEIYNFKNLFQEDKYNEGVQYISDTIKEKAKQTPDLDFDYTHFFYIDRFVDEPRQVNFYLKDNVFVFYFYPYEYTPYSIGFPEFEIPYSDLNDYLKSDIYNRLK